MKSLRSTIKYISVIGFMCVLALACAAVVFRYVLNNSIVWAEEIIRYLCIWIFFLTMFESTRCGSHLALDLLPAKLHGKPKAILDIVIEVFSIIFDCVIIRYGTQLAIVNMGQRSPALHIPYGLIYIAIPVGALLMGVFSAGRIAGCVKSIKEAAE